jgi:spermidine synthase
MMTGSRRTNDEETMVLLGSIGTILHPEARTAAVIGWGSGLSTHTLLSSSNIQSVDTIEIEPEIVKAATLFRPRVHLAYEDPRSHVQIEDAKSYFSFSRKRYDLIVSEPSNPWVSGVASLFTEEFYSRARTYLNNDGLFIQWLHLYEIDMPLVASIMNALAPYYSDYVIFAGDLGDIIIVASPTGTVPKPNSSFLTMKELSLELKRIDITGLPDIYIRTLGNKRALAPLFESFDITSNSDYVPLVDLYAVRSRFFNTSAFAFFYNLESLPALELLSRDPAIPDLGKTTFPDNRRSSAIFATNMIFDYIFWGGQWQWDHPERPISAETARNANVAKRVLGGACSSNVSQKEWQDALFRSAAGLVPRLSSNQLKRLFQRIETPSCVKNYSYFQREFIELLKSVGRRDPLLMTRHAENLLKESKFDDSDILEYILSAGMLGDLSLGKIQEAQLLWKAYGPRLANKNRQSPMIRLLVAHAYEGQKNVSDLLAVAAAQ